MRWTFPFSSNCRVVSSCWHHRRIVLTLCVCRHDAYKFWEWIFVACVCLVVISLAKVAWMSAWINQGSDGKICSLPGICSVSQLELCAECCGAHAEETPSSAHCHFVSFQRMENFCSQQQRYVPVKGMCLSWWTSMDLSVYTACCFS